MDKITEYIVNQIRHNPSVFLLFAYQLHWFLYFCLTLE